MVNFDSFNFDNPKTNLHVDVQQDHHKLIRKIGASSTVLLKNVNEALPLKEGLRSIALIGEDAGPSRKGPNGYSDHGGLDGTLAQVRRPPILPFCVFFLLENLSHYANLILSAQGWGSGTADVSSQRPLLDRL